MRNKVLPVLTNAINSSLSGSDSRKNDWILCIHISPSALIPAKHLFIHWSRSGSHGIPIMCSPEQRTAPAAVSNQECSIPRLIWWGAEQNRWAESPMPWQCHRDTPAADSQNRATVPCSTRVWVGQPAPILFLLPEPELVYLLNHSPAVEGGLLTLAELHTHIPALFLLSLPQKESQQLVGIWRGWGGQHWGKWSLTERESNWENSCSEFPLFVVLQMVFLCKNTWRSSQEHKISKAGSLSSVGHVHSVQSWS